MAFSKCCLFFSIIHCTKAFLFVAEKIARSVQAMHALHKFSTLSPLTDESKWSSYPTLSGSISFSNVQFSYLSWTSPVLKSVSFDIAPGECVAPVGTSGSEKRPSQHSCNGCTNLRREWLRLEGRMRMRLLRELVGVVSQQPNLFDASIAENIRYGGVAFSTLTYNNAISDVDIRKAAKAAKSANVHSFIMGLPQGYDTRVEENM